MIHVPGPAGARVWLGDSRDSFLGCSVYGVLTRAIMARRLSHSPAPSFPDMHLVLLCIPLREPCCKTTCLNVRLHLFIPGNIRDHRLVVSRMVSYNVFITFVIVK